MSNRPSNNVSIHQGLRSIEEEYKGGSQPIEKREKQIESVDEIHKLCTQLAAFSVVIIF